LENLDKKIARRKEINTYYRKAFADIEGIGYLPIASYGEPNYWLTCITIDPLLLKTTNEEVRLALEAENIESRPLWKPMHLQPVFAECRMRGGAVTERLFAEGLCLPSGSGITDEDLERVVGVIRKTLLA
jgi:dTDP-4-amino-4,6-dideoxygalactose transaminase